MADLKEFKLNSTSPKAQNDSEPNYVDVFKEKLSSLDKAGEDNEKEVDEWNNVWLGPQ